MNRMYFIFLFMASIILIAETHAKMAVNADTLKPLSKGKAGEDKKRSAAAGEKILIAYFSHSGNTREIADQIQKMMGGTIYEIKQVKAYPVDYDTVVDQAKKELESGYKPALRTKISDVKAFDVVFIGYPNWWGTFPAPVKTFLSEYDLSGKTIAPFCTHEGSGLGRSMADISKLCPGSILLDGLEVRGSTVKTARDKVSEWLKRIKIIE